jgi:IS4 transposase
MEPSSDTVRSLLTSLFPSGLIEDLAHEREVVQRDRKFDVRMLVWTLVLGFAADGEARSIAGYRRSYELATNQSVAPSSFYDRFSDQLADLLRDLLDHAVEEVAVPHHVAPVFQRFRDVMVADATVFRLHRLLSEFQATHDDQSGAMLYLVHNITDQSVISPEITDERVHESTLFETGSWLRGRLFLFDQGFFKYRRFALIDENDGSFVSRLKPDANPVITVELREWRDRAIPLEGKQIHDVVDHLSRQYIDAMTSPDPLDDTRVDYERVETELVAQDRDAARVSTADIDDRSARYLVSDLIGDDVVRPVADHRILVHEPSSKPFDSITQLAVFHRGWQAATGVDAEDD